MLGLLYHSCLISYVISAHQLTIQNKMKPSQSLGNSCHFIGRFPTCPSTLPTEHCLLFLAFLSKLFKISFYNGRFQLYAKLERLVLWSRFWLFKSCPILFNPTPTCFLCFHILSTLVLQLHCSKRVAVFCFGCLCLYKIVSCTMTFFFQSYIYFF